MLQAEFDKVLNLLKGNKTRFSIEELIDACINSEVTLDYMKEISVGTEKKHLLDIYEIRAKMESELNANQKVIGYDTLLPELQKTKHDHICISVLTTNVGSYIIFSDFDKTDLIGILLSKVTLQDSRSAMAEHKKFVERSGQTVQYDYTANENVFVKGNFKR
jgi:hypothetical protein